MNKRPYLRAKWDVAAYRAESPVAIRYIDFIHLRKSADRQMLGTVEGLAIIGSARSRTPGAPRGRGRKSTSRPGEARKDFARAGTESERFEKHEGRSYPIEAYCLTFIANRGESEAEQAKKELIEANSDGRFDRQEI